MTSDSKKRDLALIVDDSPEALRMLTDALDGAGMAVMVALDGASALRVVEQVTPDIILLDAIMPGMDGFDTCVRLKRNARMVDVPVIFMTGLAETEHIVRGLEAGGVDYVAKPIVIAEMLARIRVHLTNARLTRSARAALDASGRYLFAVDHTGKTIWATPQAQKLLASFESAGKIELPAPWLDWLGEAFRDTSNLKAPPSAPLAQSDKLRVHYIGRLETDEFLLRLARDTTSESIDDFSKQLGLTSREGEVLSWLSKGKTNRDIAQILGLSPRTVDKHLEQIYSKLGVENRTAAAAVAANATRNKSS
ncbi:MAG: DNA-binding response regulator [Xanthobacteraceae bacterium]|nr:DNA-binding response regulator [Xanthobacteraceae bacterium]